MVHAASKSSKKVSLECSEFGFDLDNNKYGFGVSSEIEYSTGEEIRVKGSIKIIPKRFYLRIWIGYYTLFLGIPPCFYTKKKKRKNFKLVVGYSARSISTAVYEECIKRK